MTYKDVLSDLTNLLDRHKMIQTWGYGNLSDLVTPFKKEDKTGNGTIVYDIDYPYAFLQPLQHSLQKGKVTYNFNLIMMEQCQNESQPIIDAQSNCQQYIQDVLAEIYYNFEEKYDFTLNSSLTPFKEKYDDTVSGMTANISMEIPMILNDCIAPFDPIPVPPLPPAFVLDVESDANMNFRPDIGQSPQQYRITTVDTYNGMRPDIANYYSIVTPTTGTWLFTEKGQARKTSGDIPFVNPRMLVVRPFAGAESYIQPTTSTFPTDSPIGTVFNYKCTWEIELDPALIQYIAIGDTDDAATEPQYETLTGVNLTAMYTANV